MDEVAETGDDGFVKADRMLQGLAMALLRLGVQLDINEVDESRWIYLVRQLYLVSALGGRHYVAVAGEQGAGKTLLMRNLYPDARDWLEDNPARGEKNPVAIVERTGLTEPRGIVITRRSGAEAVRTGELTKTERYTAGQRGEWQKKVQGEDPNVLMTVLEVPLGFWRLEGTGFVLLPGLERGEEQHWQQLMKIVLATSPAAVLVTDERRMANAAQQELLQQMRQGGDDLRFVVAVSRCETSSDTVITERVGRAVEVFAVDEDDVVTIGKDTSRPKGWADKLLDRVDRIRPSATDSHRLETGLLRGFVQTDLVEVLNAARQARDRRALDTSAADIVDELLGTFDQESERIREMLSRTVTTNYDSHMRKARRRLRESLKVTGGWQERKTRIGEFVKQRKNEQNERLAELVDQAWWGTKGDKADRTDGPNCAYLCSVQSVADDRWEVVGPAFTGTLTEGRLEQGVSLTLKGQTRVADPGQALERHKEALPAREGPLVQAIRALPVMALYARAFAIELAQPDGTISPVTETDLASKIEGLAKDRKQLLAALGLLLGADLAADGDIDLLNNMANLAQVLFTGSAGAAGASAVASTALLTTIGVGVVAAVLLNAGNNAMTERDRLAHDHLGAYGEAAVRSVLENVDELLRLVRDVLQARLQTALGTDDGLNAQFSLRSATQSVENIRARMLKALGNAELA